MSRRHSVVDGATFTNGTEAANAITVAIQLTSGGADLAVRGAVKGYLSNNVDGDVLEPESATLTITSGTDGSVQPFGAGNTIGSTTFLAVSEADGDIDLIITQTSGADTIYVVLIMPDGDRVVSAAVTFAA